MANATRPRKAKYNEVDSFIRMGATNIPPKSVTGNKIANNAITRTCVAKDLSKMEKITFRHVDVSAANEVFEEVVFRMNEASYFHSAKIVFDETVDPSYTAGLSLSIRDKGSNGTDNIPIATIDLAYKHYKNTIYTLDVNELFPPQMLGGSIVTIKKAVIGTGFKCPNFTMTFYVENIQ